MKLAVRLALAAAAAACVIPAARATSRVDPERCISASSRTMPSSRKIIANVPGLTLDQKQILESRIAQALAHGGLYAPVDLSGIGLTAEQIAQIRANLADAASTASGHPLGYPCPVFVHRLAVAGLVRRELVANGFAAATIRFSFPSPRVVRLLGTRSAVVYQGFVVKVSAHRIYIKVQPYYYSPNNPPASNLYLTTTFIA